MRETLHGMQMALQVSNGSSRMMMRHQRLTHIRLLTLNGSHQNKRTLLWHRSTTPKTDLLHQDTQSSTSTIMMSRMALASQSKQVLGSTKTGSQTGLIGSLTQMHSPTSMLTSHFFNQLHLMTVAASQLSLAQVAPAQQHSLLLPSQPLQCS